jgi:hypothetical protein
MLAFAQTMSAVGIPSGKRLPIGSTNIVEQYCVTNANDFVLFLHYTNTSGGNSYKIYSHSGLAFTSKAQLDAYCEQQLRIDCDAFKLLPGIDMTKPIRVEGYFEKRGSGAWLLLAKGNFTYATSNGSYVTPDLSHITPKLPPNNIAIDIAKFKWGRIEIWNAGQGLLSVPSPQPFLVTDSRYDTNHPSLANYYTAVLLYGEQYPGLLSLGIGFAYAGADGPYRIKITTVTGSNNVFEVFDESGNQIPETPLRIENLVVGQPITMDVAGGDVGRVFVILSSTNMVNWSMCTGTTNVVGTAGKVSVSVPATSTPKMYFKAMAINVPPPP